MLYCSSCLFNLKIVVLIIIYPKYIFIISYMLEWRRKWQPTPVFLPGESQGQGSLVWAAVYGVTKSQTWLSDFTFAFHFHALEKEMATHSSVLAWRIPGMGEPGGLTSMGSHRVGHDRRDLAAAAYARKHAKQLTYMPSVNPNNNQIRVAVILFNRWKSKS